VTVQVSQSISRSVLADISTRLRPTNQVRPRSGAPFC